MCWCCGSESCLRLAIPWANTKFTAVLQTLSFLICHKRWRYTGEWKYSATHPLNLDTRYRWMVSFIPWPLNKRLGMPQNWFWCFRGEENFLTFTQNWIQFFSCSAHSLVTTLSILYQPRYINLEHDKTLNNKEVSLKLSDVFHILIWVSFSNKALKQYYSQKVTHWATSGQSFDDSPTAVCTSLSQLLTELCLCQATNQSHTPIHLWHLCVQIHRHSFRMKMSSGVSWNTTCRWTSNALLACTLGLKPVSVVFNVDHTWSSVGWS